MKKDCPATEKWLNVPIELGREELAELLQMLRFAACPFQEGGRMGYQKKLLG
jgi:hypothetical protein